MTLTLKHDWTPALVAASPREPPRAHFTSGKVNGAISCGDTTFVHWLAFFWHGVPMSSSPTGQPTRFGPPRSPVAILLPSCRLPVAVLALLAPCCSPVACLLLSCRPLSLPCRFPAAFLSPSCRFLSTPVVSCRHANFCLAPSCCSPVALLSFPPVALLSLFSVASLSPPCRLPVVFLPPPCRLPVASLSPPCCPMW